MLLITIQTSPREFAGKKPPWDDKDSIHRHAVSDFLLAQRPFLIISFSQEDIVVIARMFDMLPSLIYIVIVLSIELISHHIEVFLPTINPQSQVNPTYESLLENNEKIKKFEDTTHKCVIFSELGKDLLGVFGCFFFLLIHFLLIFNRP